MYKYLFFFFMFAGSLNNYAFDYPSTSPRITNEPDYVTIQPDFFTGNMFFQYDDDVFTKIAIGTAYVHSGVNYVINVVFFNIQKREDSFDEYLPSYLATPMRVASGIVVAIPMGVLSVFSAFTPKFLDNGVKSLFSKLVPDFLKFKKNKRKKQKSSKKKLDGNEKPFTEDDLLLKVSKKVNFEVMKIEAEVLLSILERDDLSKRERAQHQKRYLEVSTALNVFNNLVAQNIDPKNIRLVVDQENI